MPSDKRCVSSDGEPSSDEPQTTQRRTALACVACPTRRNSTSTRRSASSRVLGRKVRVVLDNAFGPERFVTLAGRLKAGEGIAAPLSEPLADDWLFEFGFENCADMEFAVARGFFHGADWDGVELTIGVGENVWVRIRPVEG